MGFIAAFFGIACFLVIVFNSFYIMYFRVWLRAAGDGCPIPMGNLIAMSLRGVSIRAVSNAYIRARKFGVKIELREIESHYRQGGDVDDMIDQLIDRGATVQVP